MDFMTVPLPAAETDEPRPPDRQAPPSLKGDSDCRFEGHVREQRGTRPPPRPLPGGPTPPSLQQTRAPRRSPSSSAAPLGSESDATAPRPPSTNEWPGVAQPQDSRFTPIPILPQENPRCGRADRRPNQNQLRAVAGPIDRSSDRIVRRRLTPPPSLRQTRRTRHHHNSRTRGIPRDPEAATPGGLPHKAADTPGQAVRAERPMPDRRPRGPGRVPALPLDRTAQALPEWRAPPFWRYARWQGSLRVSADLFAQSPAQPTSAHAPTARIA